MGLLASKLGIRNFSLEDPAQPLLPYSALMESLGMGRSDAGVMVNEKQAMRLTTWHACIKIISEDLASLPLNIYQSMPDGSVRRAVEHRLWTMLHDAPNKNMTSMVFRSALLASVLGWGNGYAFVRRDKASRPVSLELLPSDRTTPTLIDGELVYVTTATPDRMPVSIQPDDVIHVMGVTMDGFVGMSPISACKNAFGLAIAAEKFGAQFFGNGSRATGVFSHPGELDAEAYENIKKSVREQATGENALRPLILEEGMTWQQMTIAPNDAQFLQTRQFQRSEIAALVRLPMHLLQDLTRSTNNNIEHQSLDYLRYTLRPWAIRVEQEMNKKLLTGPFHCQHDMNDFQRGDFASQTAGYQVLRNIGVYSANDVLRAMHQNPIPAAEGGDIRLAPLNMVPLDSLAKEAAQQPPAPSEETTDSDEGLPITDLGRSNIVRAYRGLFRDAIGRVVNRKGAPDRNFAYRALYPAVRAMAEAVFCSELPGKLTGDDEQSVNGVAGDWADRCAEWNKKNAAEAATSTTQAVYMQLRHLFLGVTQ